MGVPRNISAIAFILVSMHIHAQAPPGVIARVGDEDITAEEFQVSLEYRAMAIRETQGRDVSPDAQFRAETLAEMIDARVLRILAENKGIEADPEQVKNEYALGVMRLGGPDALPAYLEKTKLTEKQLIEEIRQRLVVEAYVVQLTQDIEITAAEIEERYASMHDAGLMERREPTVDFGYVLARTSGEDAANFAAAKKKIYQAHERIKRGEDIKTVAADLSDDALLPSNKGIYREIVPGKMLLAKTAQQLAEMQPGDVTEPFMTPDGWHVIKLLARNEPGTMPLDRARDYLESVLFEEKKTARLRETVDKAKTIIRVEIFPAEMQDKSQEENP